jgi:hypothetical protein
MHVYEKLVGRLAWLLGFIDLRELLLADGLIWRRTQRVLNLGPLHHPPLLDLLQDVGWNAGGGVQVDIDLVERDLMLGIHIAPQRI